MDGCFGENRRILTHNPRGHQGNEAALGADAHVGLLSLGFDNSQPDLHILLFLFSFCCFFFLCFPSCPPDHRPPLKPVPLTICSLLPSFCFSSSFIFFFFFLHLLLLLSLSLSLSSLSLFLLFLLSFFSFFSFFYLSSIFLSPKAQDPKKLRHLFDIATQYAAVAPHLSGHYMAHLRKFARDKNLSPVIRATHCQHCCVVFLPGSNCTARILHLGRNRELLQAPPVKTPEENDMQLDLKEPAKASEGNGKQTVKGGSKRREMKDKIRVVATSDVSVNHLKDGRRFRRNVVVT